LAATTATAIRARVVVKLDGRTALDTTRRLDNRYDLPMLLRALARQLEEEWPTNGQPIAGLQSAIPS
jgi:hypothetical protein